MTFFTIIFFNLRQIIFFFPSIQRHIRGYFARKKIGQMLARRVEDAVKEDDKVIKNIKIKCKIPQKNNFNFLNIAEQVKACEQGPPGGGPDPGRGRQAHTVSLQAR